MSEVTELFVWLTFRRMGIGSWFEECASAVARGQGSTEIRLIMNEADSASALRGSVRAFARACGYSLLWRSTVARRAAATGIKLLNETAGEQ
jgi:hypothetical protein